MSKIKKSLVASSITLCVLYVGICIFFYNIQNSILFIPRPLAEDHAFRYEFDYQERFFETTDEAKIHAIHAKTDSLKNGLVIYFHGNAGNNDTNEEKFQLFMKEGYDVLYPDYRGFGLSTGELKNEDDLVGDMRIVYSEMAKEYDESKIFLVGYSMGSGIAAQVAANNDPKGIMIWAPYYSMIDMKNASYPFLPSFLVRYPLRTDLALQQIDEPITIFYAGDDNVLPVERAVKLNQFLDGNDQHFMLEGQGHNGIFLNEELKKRVPEILEGN
jgi:pimeloyl-ACP methyl ester carboxylesterase